MEEEEDGGNITLNLIDLSSTSTVSYLNMSDEEAADIGLITAVGIDTVKDGQVGIVNSGFRFPDSAAATQVSVQMRLILVRPLTIGTRETLTGHFSTWKRHQPRKI